MKKLWFVLVIGMLVFLQCSGSKTTLSVTSLKEEPQVSVQKEMQYESFWEALENLDFDYVSTQQATLQQHRFTDALKMVVSGNFDAAINDFRALYHTSNDSLVRVHSRTILDNLLVFQSKWDELSALPNESDDTLNSETSLAAIYRQYPAEQYDFPAQPEELPLELSISGSPVIPVQINGHKRKFWLDTGAGLTCIASDVAEECGVYSEEAGDITAQTATSKRVAIQPAVIKSVQIGKINIENHPAIILNKRDLEFKLLGFIRILKVDGIIGWNAIQNMDVKIDYKNRMVTLRKPVKMNRSVRNLFWLGYPIVRVSSQDGLPLYFGLDTGANLTGLHDNILKKIDVKDAQEVNSTVGSAGGFERIKTLKIPKLTLMLNRYSLQYENLVSHPQTGAEFIKLDGTFGSDLAATGSLRIDSVNGRFEVEYPEDH